MKRFLVALLRWVQGFDIVKHVFFADKEQKVEAQRICACCHGIVYFEYSLLFKNSLFSLKKDT